MLFLNLDKETYISLNQYTNEEEIFLFGNFYDVIKKNINSLLEYFCFIKIKIYISSSLDVFNINNYKSNTVITSKSWQVSPKVE